MSKKSLKKSPNRRSPKRSPKSKRKPNAYHVTIKLKMIHPSPTNPPSRVEFLAHLKEQLTADEYLELELLGNLTMQNAVLKRDVLSFDVPFVYLDARGQKHNIEEEYVRAPIDLKRKIDFSSHADGAWESSHSNFFLMMGENYEERALITTDKVTVTKTRL
jgi:hypothetical protein